MKILNRPSPPPFTESVKYAEANLNSRASELVGDRNPREHEFSVQLRAYDASKAGQSLGVAALLAMCSTLINKSLRGGLVIVGGLNLGGFLDLSTQRHRRGGTRRRKGGQPCANARFRPEATL